MSQSTEPSISFEQFTVRILSWAFSRIEQDAVRRGLSSNIAPTLICNCTVSYLEKRGGKQR